MTTPGRRTFSGAAVACLLGVAVGLGWVPAAAHQATASADPTLVVADACPVTWPVLRTGPPDGHFDGHVSVLVGGSLTVAESAAGAEGVVVVRGNATFARGDGGPYRVGVTGTGSQVPPYADSDMLVVGRDLAAPGTPLVVGQGLGADAVVGGAVAAGTPVDLGGTLDAGVPSALAAYDGLLADLAAKSDAYAAPQATGTVDVTDTAITLTGDGVSDPQVFAVDGAGLGAVDPALGRSLQVVGVPDGAAIVVNLTGGVVDLDVDSLLAPGGATVDPSADPYFADLTTHLLWNVPGASTVDIGGQAQLPGSLLVGSGASTTTLHGAGTNGRVLVAGDLVHAGAGELHSYPFLRDADLTCGPDLKHLGALTLDVVLKDPGDIVDPDRFFEGTFACFLDGADVTPETGPGSCERRPTTGFCRGHPRRGAVLPRGTAGGAPGAGLGLGGPRDRAGEGQGRQARSAWLHGDQQRAGGEDPSAAQPTGPGSHAGPDPGPNAVGPRSGDTPAEPVDPPDTGSEDDPSAPVDEPVVPGESLPSMLPAPEAPSQSDPSDDTVAAAEPPSARDSAGPLTTTAPYSLRGAFVWGPLLLLSVLAMRLRFPWRNRRKNQSYY